MNIYTGSALFLSSSIIQMVLCRYMLPKTISTTIQSLVRTVSSTKLSSSPCDLCDAEGKPLKNIKDTVKPYKRHIILCMGETSSSWPKAIENITDSFVFKLNQIISSKKDKSFPIRITGCTYPTNTATTTGTASTNSSINTLFVYPDGYIVDVSDENLDRFVEVVSKKTALTLNDFDDFKVTTTPWKKLILCCVHANRDKRCGSRGVEVLHELNAEVKSRGISDIIVLGSSHIGGHEYAGTLITYPSGNWYGYVTKDRVPKLLDNIVNDSVFEDCHRGIGCHPNQW